MIPTLCKKEHPFLTVMAVKNVCSLLALTLHYFRHALIDIYTNHTCFHTSMPKFMGVLYKFTSHHICSIALECIDMHLHFFQLFKWICVQGIFVPWIERKSMAVLRKLCLSLRTLWCACAPIMLASIDHTDMITITVYGRSLQVHIQFSQLSYNALMCKCNCLTGLNDSTWKGYFVW